MARMAETSIKKEQLQHAVSDGSLLSTVSDLDFKELEEVGVLLAEIHNSGTLDGISYFQELSLAELSNRDRTRIAQVTKGFLERVQDTTERIVSLVHNLQDTASDSLAYNVRQGFEMWSAANPGQISEVAKLIEHGDRDSEFLGTVLHAWRRTAPSDALNATISFSDSKWPSIRRQATHALGHYKYTNQNEMLLAEERLAILMSCADPLDQRAAVFAATRLLEGQTDKSAQLLRMLEAATDQPNEGVLHELIAGLTYHSSAYPRSLREKVLTLTKTVKKDDVQTLDLIDAALYSMDINTDRNLVFEILSAILRQENEAPPLKKFDAWVHKTATSAHEIHGWYLTRWLLDGEYQICKQLDVLFPPLDKSIYDFRLDAFGLSEAEVHYLARKIYAYLIFNHGPVVSLLSACLMSLELKKRKILEKEISSFWLRNYPIDLELFDAVHSAYPRKALKASIGRMREHVEAYQAPLSTLPRNSAMAPSSSERRVQAEIAQQFDKEIGRSAHENSIFAGLFHKSTLLYGRSSVVYVYSDSSSEPLREVIQLQSFETSSALPRMDILYPARLNYLIYRFRVEERPK